MSWYLFIDMQVLEDVVLLKKHMHNTNKTLQFLQGI